MNIKYQYHSKIENWFERWSYPEHEDNSQDEMVWISNISGRYWVFAKEVGELGRFDSCVAAMMYSNKYIEENLPPLDLFEGELDFEI